MQIIPVIDLLNGIVVHGVAGERQKYGRIRSVLTDSCDPSIVMQRLVEATSAERMYLADLDAISGRHANRCVVAELTRSPCQIMIDAGVRQPADVQDLLDLGVAEVIVATETLPDIKIAEQLLRQFGPEHLVLSVDLRHGKVMSPCADWSNRSAVEVANEMIAVGFENMILLDVASVGMERGLTVNKSVETILAAHPTIRLTNGGGIRNVAELEAIRTTGLHSVLVATALHDGSISGDAAREWAARS